MTIFAGRDDIPRFLQGADVMLHPAYLESGGIVLLEALIAGLPVLTTDVCGFSPYIERAEGGVVIDSPFSQQKLNMELARVAADPELRARYSSNGANFGKTADIYRMPECAVDLIEHRLRQAPPDVLDG